jgi:hypothetical protein
MSQAMSQPNPTPWRFCASCWGICHWHNEVWVCDDCGVEWCPEQDPKRYGAP